MREKNLARLGLSFIDPQAKMIGVQAENHGLNAHIVGGSVRDALLNRPSKDFDICVSGDPEQMSKIGDWVYSQLSEKMKARYTLKLRDKETGIPGANLRDFLRTCGGGVLMSFILYLSGQTDIAPVIFPRFLVGMTKMNGEDVEFVATRSEDYSVREEGKASRKRNPGTIEVATEYEDAIRRDFTVNALYVNLSTGELLDPTGKGLSDIKSKLIRVTRDDDPEIVFLEDPLRILRAIRQSAQLGFHIEPKTSSVIHRLVSEKGFDFFGRNVEGSDSRDGYVASQRIRDEIIKILMSKNAAKGLNGLQDFGVLEIILPEVSALSSDKAARHKNLWKHTLDVLNNVKITPEIEEVIGETAIKTGKNPLILRQLTLLRLKLGALLHDVGKIEARSYGEAFCKNCQKNTTIRNLYDPKCSVCNKEIDVANAKGPTFHNHQYISERLSKNILRRLKFDSQMVKWVSRDCALHQVQFNDYLRGEISEDEPGLKPSKTMLAEKLYTYLSDASQGVSSEWDELNFAVRIYGLIQADSSANPVHQQQRVQNFITEYEAAKDKRQQEQAWQDFNKPELSGMEIMEMFSVRPGKWIGDIHSKLREDKLNNTEAHNRERAIQLAREELDKWGPEIYKQ